MKTITNEQKERIKGIIAEEFDIALEHVEDDSLLMEHLGIDSLDKISIINSIEREFDFLWVDSSDELDAILKVSDFYSMIKNVKTS